MLEPFAIQTDLLQRDSQALSSIIPSLLDLECHLQQSTASKVLTASMLRDLRHRFESILQPTSDDFNPLPAAACLLDPSYCAVLMAPDQAALLCAAKSYIVQECGDRGVSQASTTDAESADKTAFAPALQRFRFLASRMQAQEVSAAAVAQTSDAAAMQLMRYVADAAEAGNVTALEFWSSRKTTYSSIVSLAEDLLAAPASQAFVERVFSLCGLLTAGRRNRMSKSLEIRAFLKLNRQTLKFN